MGGPLTASDGHELNNELVKRGKSLFDHIGLSAASFLEFRAFEQRLLEPQDLINPKPLPPLERIWMKSSSQLPKDLPTVMHQAFMVLPLFTLFRFSQPMPKTMNGSFPPLRRTQAI